MHRLIHIVVLLLTLCLAIPLSANAHQTGKSTFVVHLKPETRQVDTLLTCPVYDVAHAAKVDAGRDGTVDVADLQAAWPALGTYLDQHLDVKNDGQPCRVIEHKLSPSETPGTFWLLKAYECDAALGRVEVFNDAMTETEGGYHHLGKIQFEDSIQPAVFTALSPTFAIDLGSTAPGEAPAADERSLLSFVLDGIVHIVFGWDHVLFVLALVLLARRLRELMITVTAFTIAHSITLVLSALDVVAIAPAIIEPIIAASIIWVAVEATFEQENRRRAYAATFILGLVHGFGFSYVLRDEVGLPTDALVPALLLFNIGVELGQLGIIAATYPIRAWARDKPWERTAVIVTATLIGLMGTYWLVERLL